MPSSIYYITFCHIGLHVYQLCIFDSDGNDGYDDTLGEMNFEIVKPNRKKNKSNFQNQVKPL